MWSDIARHLPEFGSAVLTACDGDGYPYSVRCQPQPDPVNRVLRLDLSSHVPFQPGPGSVLCHKHDEELWNQKQFLVRGRLERDDLGWHFRPAKFIPGLGIGGPWGAWRALRQCRRYAARYLQKRGLSRPEIPWDDIEALHDEVAHQE